MDERSSILSPDLMTAILGQYHQSWHGPHGIIHWARVRENGLRLARSTGANPAVLELFAVFHDACRRNEGHDPKHGPRGARLAEKLRPSHIDLDDGEFDKLLLACSEHTSGRIDGDVTVQSCWDADRLDLGRVGITPESSKLCTLAARDPAIIQWAEKRSRGGCVPALVKSWL